MDPHFEIIKPSKPKLEKINNLIAEFLKNHPGLKVTELDELFLTNQIISIMLPLKGTLLYPGSGSDTESIAGLNADKIIFYDINDRALAAAKRKNSKIICEHVDIIKNRSNLPVGKNNADIYIDKFISEIPQMVPALDYLSKNSYSFYFIPKGESLGTSYLFEKQLLTQYEYSERIVHFLFPKSIIDALSKIKRVKTRELEELFQWRIRHVKKWNIGKESATARVFHLFDK